MGHDTKWSAVFECYKYLNQERANLISIQINSLIVSDAPIRLARVSKSDYKRRNALSQCQKLIQVLTQTML